MPRPSALIKISVTDEFNRPVPPDIPSSIESNQKESYGVNSNMFDIIDFEGNENEGNGAENSNQFTNESADTSMKGVKKLIKIKSNASNGTSQANGSGNNEINGDVIKYANNKLGKSQYDAAFKLKQLGASRMFVPGVIPSSINLLTDVNEVDSTSSWKTIGFDQTGENENEGILNNEAGDENPYQMGDPYEEWLSNIEKLFIHFFLVIFDSGSPASKVMLEMFPLEASTKIEETFRILHKIDLEIYRDLEHVVFLAENWATHNIENDAKEKALSVISEYMQKCAGEGYTLLSTEDRLKHLCDFVKSLEDLGELPKRMASIVSNFVKNAPGSETDLLNHSGKAVIRPISPRVKPGSHYARVVANILCSRPCGKPIESPDVYADKVAKKYFESPILKERDLQVYLNALYGSGYSKKDLFNRINPNLYRRRLNPSHIDPMNRLCLLPLYTNNYLKKVRDGTCCPRGTRRRRSPTLPSSGYVSPRGTFHKFKIVSDSSEEWEHNLRGKRTKKRPGYVRGPYGGYVPKTYTVGKQYDKRRTRRIDSDSDSDAWVHDKKGRRTKAKSNYNRPRNRSEDVWYHDNYGNRTNLKPGRSEFDYYGNTNYKKKGGHRKGKSSVISNDSSSVGWEHDKRGIRTKRKPGYKPARRKGTKIRHMESDSDSDNWTHDKRGKRTKRKPEAKYNYKRERNKDTDSDSENWEHDKKGSRTKVKPRRRNTHKRERNKDTDSDSDNWEHDKKGSRTKVKPRRRNTHKRERNKDTDSDSDNWEHDKKGSRTKVKPRRRNTHKRERNKDTDSDSDNWEHDKKGSRTKVKPRRRNTHKRERNKDTDSDSDNWEHDQKGTRTKVKPKRRNTHKRERNKDTDSDSDNWEHDKKGTRTKVKPGHKHKQHGQESNKEKKVPKRDIDSDSDSDNWEHDKKGKRTKAKPENVRKKELIQAAKLAERKKHFVYPKRRQRRLKSITSDSDSEGWDHDEHGKRQTRKQNYQPRKAIDSDSDSDAWIHDESGKREKRKPKYKPRKNITSDSDSGAWEHDRKGQRTKRVKHYVPRKRMSSDADSDNWEHDETGQRSARKKHVRHKSRRFTERYKNSKGGDEDLNNKKKGDTPPDPLVHAHGHHGHSKKKQKLTDVLMNNIKKKGTRDKRKRKELDEKASTLKDESKVEKKFIGFSNRESLDSIEGTLLTFMSHLLDDEDEDESTPPSTGGCLEGGSGDPGINTCWELSEMLFKSPFNKNLIPSPENILHYIENTIPRARWPKGTPVATRRYPNGGLFCAMYENGSGLIFYPHGGLAVVISSPRPFNRILVIRDPLDGFFLFDNAIMANLHSIGHGAVFDTHGVLHTQYNVLGGYHIDNSVDQFSQRWRWYRGGIRLILKLNKYIRLHISKRDNISLVFNGNKRGVHLNVGAGKKVVLLKAEGAGVSSKGPARLVHGSQNATRSGTEVTSIAQTGASNSQADLNDFFDKKFPSPVLGFVDNEHEDHSEE